MLFRSIDLRELNRSNLKIRLIVNDEPSEDLTVLISSSSNGPCIVSRTSTFPPAWTNASIVLTAVLLSKSSKKPNAEMKIVQYYLLSFIEELRR